MSTTSITGAAYLEELTGFEPAMTVLQTVSLTYLDTTPENLNPNTKQQASFQQKNNMVDSVGFEPTTY